MAVHVDLLLGDSVQELLFIDTIQFQKTTSSPLRGTMVRSVGLYGSSQCG